VSFTLSGVETKNTSIYNRYRNNYFTKHSVGNEEKMKRIVLLTIGFFPLLVGYLQDHFMLTIEYYSSSLFMFLNIAVLVVWFVVGLMSVMHTGLKKGSFIFLNAPALYMLLHNLYQELILGYYLPNQLGKIGQMFYLSQMNVALNLSFAVHRLFYAYIIAFCLLVFSSLLGCVIGSYGLDDDGLFE